MCSCLHAAGYQTPSLAFLGLVLVLCLDPSSLPCHSFAFLSLSSPTKSSSWLSFADCRPSLEIAQCGTHCFLAEYGRLSQGSQTIVLRCSLSPSARDCAIEVAIAIETATNLLAQSGVLVEGSSLSTDVHSQVRKHYQCLSRISKGDWIAIRKPEICDRDRMRSDTKNGALAAGVLAIKVSLIGCYS